ncbi:MAG: DUF5069 domain-containing protein [Nitrospira sp.]|nr:DUF5069 domain-containing protein [Nitrospira sp.]
MTQPAYPRSPKVLLGGIAHLGRFIDKVRLRHAGKIQDYNYITVGFDKYLIDFLQIDPKAFEQQVLAGGSDESLLAWVKTHGRKHSEQEIAEWSKGILTGGPKDDAARQRYQGRLQDIATKRGVPVTALLPQPPGSMRSSWTKAGCKIAAEARGESLSHLGPSGGLRLEDDGAGRGADDHAVLTAVDGQHPLIRRPGDVKKTAGVGRKSQRAFTGDGDGHMPVTPQLDNFFVWPK